MTATASAGSSAKDAEGGAEAARARAADRARWLEAGLDRAARSSGWTSVVVPAALAEPALLATTAGGPTDGVAVWWPPRGEALVGLGAAAIVRGHGAGRWQQVREQAEALCARIDSRVVAGELVTTSPHLGPARPRLLGGLSFSPGSAAAPPWTALGDAWFMLPRWTYVSDGNSALLTLCVDRERAGERARLRAELAAIDKALAAGRHAGRPRARVAELTEDGEAWMECVAAARDFINAGGADKIVAARCQHLRLGEPVRAGDVLAALAERHPDCYRVMVAPEQMPEQTAEQAVWLAATPERLVQRSGRRVLCDALAGSIPRRGDTEAELAALLASSKERREHDLVVTAIADTLRQLGVQVEHDAAPAVRSLRHVHHLATPIQGDLTRDVHVLDIAAALHPTPAVGGTPTATAIDWLLAHESQPRGWYAAPIGWFDRQGDGELAVGIRSGLLAGDSAHLWAGAGIVGASEPARELAETQVKLRALRGALGLDE